MRPFILALPVAMLLASWPGLRVAAADDGEREAVPVNATGVWRGTLESPDLKRRLVVRIRREAGGLGGTLDSIDEKLTGLKLSNLTVTEDVLSFLVPETGARFAGNFSSDGDAIRGNWSADYGSIPLVLRRD